MPESGFDIEITLRDAWVRIWKSVSSAISAKPAIALYALAIGVVIGAVFL